MSTRTFDTYPEPEDHNEHAPPIPTATPGNEGGNGLSGQALVTPVNAAATEGTLGSVNQAGSTPAPVAAAPTPKDLS